MLVLVRPDLVEEPVNEDTGAALPTNNTYSQGFATGLEGYAKNLLQKLTKDFTYDSTIDAVTFSNVVLGAVEKVADEMLMAYKPSESILEALADEINAILKDCKTCFAHNI